MKTVGAKFKTIKRRAVLYRMGRKLCKSMLWVLKVERGSAYWTKFMDKKIYHGLLNMEEAHLAEVMDLTLVGAW